MDCSTAFILYCFLFWSNRQPIQIHPLLQPLSPTPLHLSGVGCPDSWARVGQSVRATVHWGFSEAHFQQTSPESCSQHSVFFLHFLLSVQYNLLAPRWSQLTALSFWGLCCCSSRPRLFFFCSDPAVMPWTPHSRTAGSLPIFCSRLKTLLQMASRHPKLALMSYS